MIKEINTKLNAFEIFTIFRDEKDSFILDSAMDKNKLGRYSFISSNPFKVLKYKDSKDAKTHKVVINNNFFISIFFSTIFVNKSAIIIENNGIAGIKTFPL